MGSSKRDIKVVTLEQPDEVGPLSGAAPTCQVSSPVRAPPCWTAPITFSIWSRRDATRRGCPTRWSGFNHFPEGQWSETGCFG